MKKTMAKILVGVLLLANLSACDRGCEHDWYVITDAFEGRVQTCTTDGIVLQTCLKCGEEDYVIKKSFGHSLIKVKERKETCGEDGWGEYFECENPGCTYNTRVIIPATGKHSYLNGQCSICGEVDVNPRITITFKGWGDTEEENNYIQLINQFMTDNPNITVAYSCEDASTYMTTLTQSANNLPDMFYMGDEDFMQWVSAGLLKDISSYVTEQELSTIWPHAVDEYYFNMDDYTLGKSEGAGLYGLPKDLGPFTLVYNKALVASKISQYNLDTEIYQGTTTWAQHINSKLSATVPMTWQEFRAILKKIDQDPNDNFYGISHYELDSAIYSNNASYFDDTASISKITEKNFTDALQFVADLHLVDGVMPSAQNQNSTNGYQRFLNGTAAFSFMGPWDNAAFWKQFDGDYDILPVPYNGENPNAKSVTWVGSTGYCIAKSANAAETQACVKLAKYLCMDEEVQRDFYALGQQVPNIIDMAMGEYLTDSEGRLANNSVIIDGAATPMNTASKPASRSVWVDVIDGDDSDNISGKTRPCYYTYQSDWESVFLTYINDQGLWTGTKTAAQICAAYNATFQYALDDMRAAAGF